MIQLGPPQMPFNHQMPRGMHVPGPMRAMSAQSAPPQLMPPGASREQDQQSLEDKTLNPPKKTVPPLLDADVVDDIRAKMLTQVCGGFRSNSFGCTKTLDLQSTIIVS